MLELAVLSICAPALIFLAMFLIREGDWTEIVGLSIFVLLIFLEVLAIHDVLVIDKRIDLENMLAGIIIAWIVVAKYHRILLNLPKLKKLKEKARNSVPQDTVDAFSIICNTRGISFACNMDGIELYDIMVNDGKDATSQIARVRLSYDAGDIDFFIFVKKRISCMTFLTNKGTCRIELA